MSRIQVQPLAYLAIMASGSAGFRYLVSLVLVFIGLRFQLAHRWEQAGYGFILSGALGNGIDRFFNGEVVDFLDFRLIRFPIFNVADICINIGIACLLIAAFTANGDGNINSSGKGGKKRRS